MKVLLARNLYIGGVLYERQSLGNEIPDEVDGIKVVLWTKENKAKSSAEAETGDRTIMVLPPDVKLYTEPGIKLDTDLLHNAKVEPTTLSEMSKKK